MLCRTRTLPGALILIIALAGACPLDDKLVGGAEPDEEVPGPCAVYCERVSECLGEDEEQCVLECPENNLDAACRDAVISVLTCLEITSCDDLDLPSPPCDDVLRTRDDACET